MGRPPDEERGREPQTKRRSPQRHRDTEKSTEEKKMMKRGRMHRTISRPDGSGLRFASRQVGTSLRSAQTQRHREKRRMKREG
jgi:hypothetical protein